MTILVTGASGYIGRATLKALIVQDVEVVAVSRRRPTVAGTYRWIEADLLGRGLDATALRSLGVTTVVHLAWNVDHGQFWTTEANLDWTTATLHLARAACDAGVSRFVGTGTCYEYDWPADGDCHEETTPLLPRSLYAVTKDATRRLLDAYFEQHSVAFCWARLFFIYGGDEGHARLVPSICRTLVSGQPALCSSGTAIRDYADVRDVGHAMAALALADLTGPVNVGSGRATRVADIAEMLGRLSGRPDLVCLGALPDRIGDPPRVVGDASRIRRAAVSFRALEQGLAEALRHWQSYLPRP